MDLISLLIVLIVVGAIVYVAQSLPIDATIKKIIYVIALVAVAIWLLRNLPALGL